MQEPQQQQKAQPAITMENGSASRVSNNNAAQ
jgi:hypothetical protein